MNKTKTKFKIGICISIFFILPKKAGFFLDKQAKIYYKHNVYLSNAHKESDDLLEEVLGKRSFTNFQLQINAKSKTESMFLKIDKYQEKEHAISNNTINQELHDLNQISIGDGAVVQDKFKASVYNIEPSLSSNSKKAKVKILLQDSVPLVLGSLVDVKLPIKSLNGEILIPLKSVKIGEQSNRVQIAENNKLAWREVEVEKSESSNLIICG